MLQEPCTARPVQVRSCMTGCSSYWRPGHLPSSASGRSCGNSNIWSGVGFCRISPCCCRTWSVRCSPQSTCCIGRVGLGSQPGLGCGPSCNAWVSACCDPPKWTTLCILNTCIYVGQFFYCWETWTWHCWNGNVCRTPPPPCLKLPQAGSRSNIWKQRTETTHSVEVQVR